MDTLSFHKADLFPPFESLIQTQCEKNRNRNLYNFKTFIYYLF